MTVQKRQISTRTFWASFAILFCCNVIHKQSTKLNALIKLSTHCYHVNDFFIQKYVSTKLGSSLHRTSKDLLYDGGDDKVAKCYFHEQDDGNGGMEKW